MTVFSSWKREGDTIVRRTVQLDEDKILNFNNEIRKNPGAINSLSFMGAELNIPVLHLRRLWKKYPELNAKNGQVRTAAWMKFMGSSEADIYRLKDRSKARGVPHTAQTTR